MDFEIDRIHFLDGLNLTQGVVEKRNTLPILSNVLIEAAGSDGISILATDLDVGVRHVCSCSVRDGGRLTVGARKLFEIVREMAGDCVRVRTAEKFSVEVVSGRSRFKLLGLNPEEFPSIPGLSAKPSNTAVSMTATTADLGRMIESTIFAVSMDETRFNLSGIYVENHDGWLRMVATDGHRLAMIDGKVEGKLPEKGAILPRKGLSEVKKLLESGADKNELVTFLLDGSIAKVVRGHGELFMRLIDGEFPDYHQVVPKKGKCTTIMSREDFLRALRRVSILSTERSRGVRLIFKAGALEIQTSNPDLGEATEEINVTYAGPELSVGFNARYLIEALDVMGDCNSVEFTVNDDVSPGVLHPEGDERYCYVVMPMRL